MRKNPLEKKKQEGHVAAFGGGFFFASKEGEGTRCAFRLAMDEQRRMLPPLFVRSRGGNSPILH